MLPVGDGVSIRAIAVVLKLTYGHVGASLFFTEIPGDSIMCLLSGAAGAVLVVQMEMKMLNVTRPERVDSD